ncbi:MAG: hypothetical protein KAX50_06925 [Saprospiraceae bacterium]|nr:hypothetical protein [Saprospiraceae bacterium]
MENPLLTAAILGLDRQELPQEAKAAALPHDDEASALLRAWARRHLLDKASGILPDAPPLPVPDAADEHAADERAARLVHQILNGPYREAWDEMLSVLKATGKTMPVSSLPLVLEWLAKDKSRLEEVRPLLGSRGRWLMAQLPEWQVFLQTPDPAAWSVESLDTRKKILQGLRQSEPATALQLLRSTWQEDGWKERHQLLAKLETGLTLADESFLEACLEDKRREIRQTAARLLALLRGSALSERLHSYARTFMKLLPSGLWQLLPPEQTPAAWQRDGIDGAGAGNGGPKAMLIRQLFGNIAPQHWASLFGAEDKELLRQIEANEWSGALTEGLIDAVVRFRDRDQAEVLFRHWRFKFVDELPGGWERLTALLSEGVFADIVRESLPGSVALLPDRSMAFYLLMNKAAAWPADIAAQVIGGLRQWLAQSAVPDWSAMHYRALLKTAAFRCPVVLLSDLERDWPAANAKVWYYWENDVRIFLRILAFRKEMTDTLGTPSNSRA